MKILITGASSKLATFVIRELENHHELVLTSQRPPAPEFANLPWIPADLTCFEACQRVVQDIEAIQHIAAQPEPTDHPNLKAHFAQQGIAFDATFKVNLLGTYYLLQAAIAAKVHTIVMTGSNCVLGHGFRISGTPFPFQYFPLDEQHPCYPEDTYSFSKLAGEELLASYSRAYGIRTYVVRPAGIRTGEQRRQMAIAAQPSQGWDPWLWGWVGSEDVAQAQRLVLEAAPDLPRHDVYFVNADDTHALEPTAELIERFQPELKSWAEHFTGHQALISCNKIKQRLGWQPKTSWRQSQ